jgi:hypothetical protein
MKCCVSFNRPKHNVFSIIFLPALFLIYSVFGCRSKVELGQKGEITKGQIYPKCSKPDKRYTKTVEVAVKGTTKSWGSLTEAELASTVKTDVIKLTDYSQQGLDRDLLIFRICELGNNRILSAVQVQELMVLGMNTWDSRMSIKEQKNIISQLNVELISNLKTAKELKLNVETILGALNMVSGDQILRNSKIEILPLLFPKSNLDSQPSKSTSDLTDDGLKEYTRRGLDTNKLERQKFSAVANVISLTLDKTFPTLNSLADKDRTRYAMSSVIWTANAPRLSKIDIFEPTKFQATYSDLNSLRTNYDVVIGRALDYLTDLNAFFKPEDKAITRNGLVKILTSERFAYDLIKTYSESLTKNIESLSKLQLVVNETIN